MTTATASVATANASRYLQQLCKHWSHRFTTEFTPERGSIALDDAQCLLEATPEHLAIRIEASADRIARLEEVVADHIKRFAFREELAFRWSRQP